jgi:hypothetical protein
MPDFEPASRTSQDDDWVLLMNSPVHLFSGEEALAGTIGWLGQQGYHVIEIDTASWRQADNLHSGIARSMGFPEYYGRNLNALNDCLDDVAFYEYGARRESTGTVVVLRGFEQFARSNHDLAWALLDIYARVARRALLIGHRMLCLVQTNDPDIQFDPVGASPVMWNPKEFFRARKQT